jgi:hypothetical protein
MIPCEIDGNQPPLASDARSYLAWRHPPGASHADAGADSLSSAPAFLYADAGISWDNGRAVQGPDQDDARVPGSARPLTGESVVSPDSAEEQP